MWLLVGYPKVSVIVLNYNGVRYATNCFKSLGKQTYPNYEVIMVDNSSKDESVDFVRQCFPWVKIIRNSLNLGYAKANNEAAKQVDGDYILFLNEDTWVKYDLLDVLVSAVTKDPMIGVCACTQFSYDGKFKLNAGMTIDLIAYPVIPNEGEQILYADGASLFIKKSLFMQLGGFDDEYFMYAEEVDLCWRVLLSGFDVTAVPRAIVGHKSAGTFVMSEETYCVNKFRRYLAERNSLRTLLKNYSAFTLLYMLPLRVILTFEQIFLFMMVNSDFVMVEIRAIIWNVKRLKETFTLRNFVQTNRRVSDRKIMKRMSKIIGLARSFATIHQDSLGIRWEE